MKLGSLCSGIGGLELGVERALGAVTVWQSEIDPHASSVLARHWPGVPNLGDLTAVDWTHAERVDLLTAGYPCQPFSHAGRRQGESDDRHLWPGVLRAVRVLRPRYVLLENVAGHLSLGFGSVLGDLAEAGYDTEWTCLRSSDVGAPHRRERVFIAAHAERGRVDADRRPRGRDAGRGDTTRRAAVPAGPEMALATDSQPRRSCPAAVAVDERREGTISQPLRHDGGGDRRSVADSASGGRRAHDALDQSPGEQPDVAGCASADANRGGWDREPAGDDDGWHEAVRCQTIRVANDRAVAWGPYEPAVRCWEAVSGRAAPAPTDTRGRLNPPFVEWMLGYPEGWVDGLTRTAALRCLGNSVQPQVSELAARQLLAHLEAAA